MSVAGSAVHAKIDPIKGQDAVMRFSGQNTTTGDGSGGYVGVSIYLPASSLMKPYWLLKNINAWSNCDLSTTYGIIDIITYDPQIGMLVNRLYGFEWIISLYYPTGQVSCMNSKSVEGVIPKYPYRYNAQISGGLYPQVNLYAFNVNTRIFQLTVDGFFVDESVLPKVLPSLGL